MPSTHSQPLNPRLAAAAPSAAAPPRPAAPAMPAPAQRAGAQAEDAVDEAAEAARAGGFHESSYELRSGLEISESEWPPDTTIPGALGER
jgi:membrane-bound lytic murein transglycosylase B